MMLVPTVVTITVGFAAFSVYLDRVQRENLIADVDDELIRAERAFAARVEPRIERDAQPNSPADEAVASAGSDLADEVDPPVQLLVGLDGQLLADAGGSSPFDSSALAAMAGNSGVFTVEDPRYRVRATDRGDGTVAVTALSLDQIDDTIADFRRTLLGGGVVILALEAGVVWLLAAGLARPVTRMATTATRIADGAIDTEIDPPSGSRETAVLADDLSRMVNQLRSVIDDRERAAADATQARDNMQRFLADASHELRTPLTALKGYSDLYAGNMLGEPGALDRAMVRIGSESERLHGLVNDMLQLAREAPLTDRVEPVNIGDIVQVVVDDLRAAHPEVSIELEVAPDAATVVSGRPDRLQQALLNVGSNAVDHTDAEAGVQFRVRSTDANVVVDVVDHGPGVDSGEVDKIFLPFYRHDTSRGRDGRGGAGLGLAISHQIIERHHGTVTVAATPGGGATFTLTMPIAPVE